MIQLLASAEKCDEIAAKYRAGNYGYGHAKLELLEIILKYFKVPRERFAEFEQDSSLILEKVEQGNEVARKIAEKKFKEMSELVGL